jgi:hypothetical protein
VCVSLGKATNTPSCWNRDRRGRVRAQTLIGGCIRTLCLPGSCHGSWWVRHVRLTGRGHLRRRPRGFRLWPCAMITRRYPMAGRHFSQDSTWRGHAAIDWGLGVVRVVRWLSVCNDGNETRPGCCPVGIGGQQATATCGRQHAASTQHGRWQTSASHGPCICACKAKRAAGDVPLQRDCTCRPFCESAMQPGTRSRRSPPLLWCDVLSWV